MVDESFIRESALLSLAQLSEGYQKTQPYPFLYFDKLFDKKKITEAANHFPGSNDSFWFRYDTALERKLAKPDLSDAPTPIKHLIHELSENRFVAVLEKLTGIDGLIVDHTLSGGGLHQTLPGGKLDVHADFNYHPVTRLDRRVNVIVYLNKNWNALWGGELEIWDKGMKECKTRILPILGRMVIFNITDDSLHGHPDPLTCPQNESRKSIALYYYTNGRPAHEVSPPHRVLFKKRLQDPCDTALDLLRIERSQPKRYS